MPQLIPADCAQAPVHVPIVVEDNTRATDSRATATSVRTRSRSTQALVAAPQPAQHVGALQPCALTQVAFGTLAAQWQRHGNQHPVPQIVLALRPTSPLRDVKAALHVGLDRKVVAVFEELRKECAAENRLSSATPQGVTFCEDQADASLQSFPTTAVRLFLFGFLFGVA